MKVTPASVKIRRWFVAGVAAVMAIAWTVSSLVTPGTADVGGNSEPGKNVSVGQATNAGGVQPATHYNANKSYSPREDIQLTAKFLGIPITAGEYKVRLRNASGRPVFQGSGVGKTDLTGNNGQKYNAICIDSLGTDPDHKRNRGGYSNDSIENHPRSNPTAGMALMAKKMAYLWGNDVAARNYDNIYSKTGVAKHGNADQYIAAAVYGAHMAFWALDGKVDFDQSEVLTRVGGIGGNEWPAPNVDPKAREIAKKMWEMAKKVKLPASMVGVAGTQPGSSVGSAGFDANGNFVVNYELTGPASASGKEATLNITTAGNPGLPEGATLVDNATARDLKNGSKVTLPASVTLTLPANAANAYKKVQIQATTTNNQNVGATTRIPIDITGQAGKRVNAYVQGLPQGGKLTYANGQEFINGTAVNVPTRLYAIVPSGSQGTLSVQLSRPSGDDTKAAVAVMEQTRSVDTNGDMYVRIGVSGYSDSGKAVMRVSSLPAGVTLVDQNGRPVTNGAHADLPSTLTLKVPAGTPAGNVTIGAATSSLTGSSLGTVLKPSYDKAQWITIINGPPGGSSTANAEIGVRWSERPNRPEKGSFTLTKDVTAPDGAGDANKTFTFNVTCTDKTGADVPVDPVVLKKGQSKTVGDFPVGTKCVVDEDEVTAAYVDGSLVWTGVSYSGGNGGEPNEVVIGDSSSSVVSVVATNNYEKPKPREGQFTVRKVVSGVDSGTVVNNSFKFEVSCTGQASVNFDLQNSGSKVIGPFPVGTKCSIRENTAEGTEIPGYKFNGVTYRGSNVDGHADQVTITEGMSADYSFTATNNYQKVRKGHFKVRKGFEENSKFKDPNRLYHFKVSCTKDGEAVGSEYLAASENRPATTRDYEVGTKCVVQEDVADADTVPGYRLVAVRYPVGPGITVTGESNKNDSATDNGTVRNKDAYVTVTVKEVTTSHLDGRENVIVVDACNEYEKDQGTFSLKKMVEGGPAAVDNAFSFDVVCDDDTMETLVVRDGRTVRSNEHPDGTECSITENESSAAIEGYTFNGVSYSGSNVSEAYDPQAKSYKVRIDSVGSTPVLVTAKNSYERQEGTLSVRKVVEGGPATVNNTYHFKATCDGREYRVTAKANQTVPFGTFPVGTKCVVEEEATGRAISGYTFGGVTYEGGTDKKPNQVTISEGNQTYTITAKNSYSQDMGSFEIVKHFAEDSSFQGDSKKAYEFVVKCAGKPVDNVVVNEASSWKWTSKAYPVGTRCSVSEKGTVGVKGHSFRGVSIVSTSGTVENKVAEFEIVKGDTPAVTVTAVNDYVQPTLQTNASVQGKNKLTKGVETQLVDKLMFTNLEKGKTYTAGGYFIDKATKKAVTGFYTRSFTSADLKGVSEVNGLVSGYLELTDPAWKVTPSSHGQAFVAFEYLWEGELPSVPEVPVNPGTDKVTPKPDVEHENPDDPNQTVSSEEKGSFTIEKKLAGSAAGKVTKDAVFPFTVNCGVERVEKVSVGKKFVSEDLPVGTECSVTENDPVAHFEGATFKNVAYMLDGAPVSGKTVTFTIKKGDSPQVAVVATNTYDTPTVTTDATPKVPAQEAKSVEVVDNVSYTNLIAGKQYTVEGQLHYQDGDAGDASDGGVVKGVQPGTGCNVDGKVVEGQECRAGTVADSVAYTFTAPIPQGAKAGDLVSGTVNLVFSVPAKAVQSKPMVVFEDVYHDGKKVVGHHDINDNNQTVPVAGRIEFPIKKVLAGDGASQANGTYNFVANCVAPGKKGSDQEISVTVNNGESAVSAKKVVAYVGETCTIKEVGPANNPVLASSVKFADGGVEGATGGKTLTVKVTDANKAKLSEAAFAFEATNTVTVNKASFSVTKTDATAEGNVTLPRSYTFEYNCGGQTGSLSVVRGETKASPDFPIGTRCTVRETGVDVSNADLTTTWTIGGAPASANASGEVEFSLGETNSVVKVAASNHYVEKTGGFSLSKKLTTSVTTQMLEGTTFKFAYVCKDGDRVVKRSQTPLEVSANGQAVMVNGVGVGARCSVREVELPKTPNAVHSLSWMVDDVEVTGDSAEFVVGSQSVPVSVSAHNVYTDKKPGFQVVKAVSGDAKEVSPDAKYVFDYSCDNGRVTGDFTLTSGGASFQSAHDPRLADLEVGSECRISERKPAGVVDAQWKGVVFDRSGNTSGTWHTDTANHAVTFSVPAGDSAVVVKATNRFDQLRGKISVTKVVRGNGVKNIPSSFSFGLECSYDGSSFEVDPSTKTVAAGETAEWNNLLVGAQCVVTELDSTVPANATHELSWLVDGEDKGQVKSVTVPVGDSDSGVVVTARNTYANNPARISVRKASAVVTGESVDGKPGPKVPAEFSFEYRCGDDTGWTKLGPVSAGGEPVIAEGLPAGASCEIREVADGLNRVSDWSVNGVAYTGVNKVAFQTTPGATVEFSVDNKYPNGPEIGTTLTDGAGSHDVSADGELVSLKDTVRYYNLDTAKTYTVSGKLMAWNSAGEVVETGIVSQPVQFRPSSPSGEVVVNFEVPSVKLDEFGKMVAYEELTLDGEVVARHENPEDPNQVVKVRPKIKTTLTGEDGVSKSYDRPTVSEGYVTLVDRVEYRNLRVGKTYRISGELYGDQGLTGVKAWSEAFTVKAPADNPDAEFVSGSKNIVFSVGVGVLKDNSKLVAFEKLWDEGKINPPTPNEPTTPSKPGVTPPTPTDPNTPPDATHEDPNDPDQTVKRNPSIATSARVKDDNGKDAQVKTIRLTGKPGQTAEVMDHLSWYSLPEGDYVAVAKAFDSTGKAFEGDSSARGMKAFSVESSQAAGSVDVAMSVVLKQGAEATRSVDLVVYEYVYRASDVSDGKPRDGALPVASHEDAKDPDQTIRLTLEPPLPPQGKLVIAKDVNTAPEGVSALPADTLFGFDMSCGDDDSGVIHFAVKAGKEHAKKDGWPTNMMGKQCRVVEVGPVKDQWNEETGGWQKLELSEEQGQWVKVMWYQGTNADDTIEQDSKQGPHSGKNPSNRAYTFTVNMEGNGADEPIYIKAENFYGPLPKPALKTSAEDMRHNQGDTDKPDRMIRQGSDGAIEDTVTFTDLEAGKEYTIKGQIMDYATKAPLTSVSTTQANGCGIKIGEADKTMINCKDEGNGVISLTFSPQGQAGSYVSGEAYLQFRIPAQAVKKDAKFVVFEKAFENGKEEPVAVHEDFEDPDQTITTNGCPPVPPTEDNPPRPDLPPDTPVTPPHNPEVPGGPDNCPVIGTQLNVDGGAEKLVRGKDHEMTDIVSYEDLNPNTTYKILGRLHVDDKTGKDGVITSAKPGQTCMADGKKVACVDEGNGFVSLTFTTGEANNQRGFSDGTVEMGFVIPAEAIKDAKKVVAFESAFNNKGTIIAWHHNINAPEQTRLVEEPPTPPEAPEPPTPTLATSAEDMRHNGPDSPDRMIRQGSDGAIEDTVSFTNFQVGKQYTIKGQIIDSATENPLTSVSATNINECGIRMEGSNRKNVECKDEGNGVISLTFSPQGEADAYVNGEAYLQFRIPAQAVKEDAKFVVFEEAFVNEGGNLKPVAEHKDLTDPKQTITTNGCPPVPPTEDNPPRPDLPPDTPVTPPHNPEIPGGPDNCPVIGTKLNIDSGAEKLVRGKDHKMTDIVSYEDLNPNTTYKILGRLHVADKANKEGIITNAKPGQTCKADGKKVACVDEGNGFVSLTFTTGEANNQRGFSDGTVEIGFILPAKALENTNKVVAFETAFDEEGTIIAWHHNINDKEQTRLVEQPQPPAPPTTTPPGPTPPTPLIPYLPNTGAATITLLILGLMGLIGGALLIWANPRRKQQQ